VKSAVAAGASVEAVPPLQTQSELTTRHAGAAHTDRPTRQTHTLLVRPSMEHITATRQ